MQFGMLDLCTHTAIAIEASPSSQLTIRVQLADTVKNMVIPVHACISIPLPSPFLPNSGNPPLPWRVWFMVFSSYLHLLEEDQGELWPDLIRNSLLSSLLGTWGHQQLAGSPVV